MQFHNDGYGRPSHPAINVKVRGWWRNVPLPLNLGSYSDDGGKTWKESTSHPAFTREAIEPLMESHGDAAFDSVCASFWECVRDEAREMLAHPGIEVYSEGRSSGWVVVHRLPDVETWDAIMLARWRRFEVWCESCARDVPRDMLEWIYLNAWDQRQQHVEAEAAEHLLSQEGASA